MKISKQTKVSEVIRYSSQTIEALIRISPAFRKLKNPLLRKLMASRVNLEQAANIGGVRVDDILLALEPLGFEIMDGNNVSNKLSEIKNLPAFASDIGKFKITYFDVRDIIASDGDPLSPIMEGLKTLNDGALFCIINTFVPIPLIHLLEKKGFESFVEKKENNQFYTYFKKISTVPFTVEPGISNLRIESEFWKILKSYQANVIELDVRHLEMPAPMHAILKMLENLPEEKILYVHHKKIPVYLLPELEERDFEYLIHEVAADSVKLIIRHK